MNVTWILGWAIPVAWFDPLARTAFPTAEHRFITATPNTAAELAALGDADLLMGYSLGAQLLLGDVARCRARMGIGLLAPIFAFPAERGLGGRVSATQVSYLARWVRRDPLAALQDFYRRAGLDVPPELAPTQDRDALAWGLDQLLHGNVAAKLPPGAIAVAGSEDPLLDAAKLHAIEARVEVVPGGTHHPRTLLPALAQRLSHAAGAAPC
jgi:hypothetical protein